MTWNDNSEPPPYALVGSHSGATPYLRQDHDLPPLPTQAEPDSTDQEKTFSQIRLDTHFNDIKGTYRIDPKNPTSELKNKKARVKRVPDAAFYSRSGKIILSLATTGLASQVPKAVVSVTSKSGNITLNLLPADATRPRFELDVKSNSGTVVIFIPSTYGGAIQLHTKSGSLEYLPALAARINVVKSAEAESLVLFGKQPAPSSQVPSDFCHVRTRSGKVIIGLRGEDKYVEELGLWQRIFRGETKQEDTSSP